MVYNLLTCGGFGGPAFGGGCTMAWIIIPILFFLFAFIRQWGAEAWGFEFSFMGCLVLCYLGFFIAITLTGAYKVGLIVGIVGGLVGGYGGPMFGLEGGEE